MKNIRILKFATLSVLFIGLWGCNSMFEDVAPSTEVSSAAALESEAGINGIRTSMYSKMLGSFDLTTEYFIGPSALADESFNRPGSTRFNAQNNAIGTGGTTHIAPFGAYELIQDANLIINAIPDGVIEDAVRDQFRGEALALRAMSYHALVRAYGYEPTSSNAFGLGTMLRTAATLDLSEAEPKPRSTVAEIYTQILADLTESATLLTANGSVIGGANDYVTYEYVLALRARVLLYQGNYSAAVTAAQAAISAATTGGVTLQSSAADVASMWSKANPEALFELNINASTEAIAGSNTNSGLVAYTSDQWVAQVPTNTVMDAYDPADFRYTGWYGDCIAQQTVGATANSCGDINDEAVSSSKWVGWKGNLVTNVPYFRISELYLIQAEAAAKATNVAAGIAPLNTLRAARGLAPVAAGDFANAAAFEDEILNERIRELAFEGHRFWDLKRLGRNVLTKDGAIKMRADAFRILAPFGTGTQTVNPLLVENPGYDTVE